MLKWLASKFPGQRRKQEEAEGILRKSRAAVKRYDELDDRLQKKIKENPIDAIFAESQREAARKHAEL